MESARQMFFDFSCSIVSMGREGVLNEYRAYEVTDEQETTWRNEYIDQYLKEYFKELSTDITSYTSPASIKLQRCDAVEAIPELMLFNNFKDDYFKLKHAELLNNLSMPIDGYESSQEKKQARETTKSILMELSLSKSAIPDKSKSFLTTYIKETLGYSNVEEYIKKCAEKLLKTFL